MSVLGQTELATLISDIRDNYFEFAKQLLNQQEIEFTRKLLQNNLALQEEVQELIQKQAENSLKCFLEQNLGEEEEEIPSKMHGIAVQVEKEFDESYQMMSKLWASNDWQLVKETNDGKEWRIANDSVWYWKFQSKIRVSKNTWVHIKKHQFPAVCALATKHDDNYKQEVLYSDEKRTDLYIVRKLPFPITSRDWMSSYHFIENFHGNPAQLGFSIQNPEKPVTKNM